MEGIKARLAMAAIVGLLGAEEFFPDVQPRRRGPSGPSGGADEEKGALGPSEITGARREQKEVPQAVTHERKYTAGRNDPRPCGSGKRFKKCCINVTITKPVVRTTHLYEELEWSEPKKEKQGWDDGVKWWKRKKRKK